MIQVYVSLVITVIALTLTVGLLVALQGGMGRRTQRTSVLLAAGVGAGLLGMGIGPAFGHDSELFVGPGAALLAVAVVAYLLDRDAMRPPLK